MASRVEELAHEIMDGVLLSDGSLVRPGPISAHFQMGLSGEEHIDWLLHVKTALAVLGVEVCAGHPKVIDAVSRGKPYKLCLLVSRTSPFYLDSEYLRWYKNDKKEVPANFVLTPASLANWHVGDGCNVNGYNAELCTEGFSSRSVGILEEELCRLGVRTSRHKRQHGERLFILHGGLELFMNMIAPHVVESYLYKVEYKPY